jgi:hypothetical protein
MRMEGGKILKTECNKIPRKNYRGRFLELLNSPDPFLLSEKFSIKRY